MIQCQAEGMMHNMTSVCTIKFEIHRCMVFTRIQKERPFLLQWALEEVITLGPHLLESHK